MPTFIMFIGIMLIQSRALCYLYGEAVESKMREWPDLHQKLFQFLYWLGWAEVLLGGILQYGWLGILAPVFLRIAGWIIEKIMLMQVKILQKHNEKQSTERNHHEEKELP